MTRRGFTLVEVMIALVVTGLVVALAYGTVQAGFDVDARLASHRAGAGAEATVRALIDDALRHAVPGIRGGEPVFVLEDRAAGDGTPNDSLRFVSRGVLPPLGTSERWVVSLSVDGAGLLFEARPASAGDAGLPVVARLGNVRGIDVRALGTGIAANWRDEWDERDVAPEAVAVSLLRKDRSVGASSLVTHIGLERMP